MAIRNAPIIVISGSIGSGKGTIIHALANELDLTWIPTHTTRPVRKDDDTLSKRVFDTEATFLRSLARSEFIETTEIAGNRYGLLRGDIDRERKAGRPSIVELSVDGGLKVGKAYDRSLLIFLTSDEKDRKKRIENRGMDPDEMRDRLKDSVREEKVAKQQYDYIIENVEGHPEAAIDAIKKIIIENFPELAQ